jgi:hypothetical protein
MNPQQNPFKTDFKEKNLHDDFIGEKLNKKPWLSRRNIILASAVGTFLVIFIVIPLFIFSLVRNTSPNIPLGQFRRMTDVQIRDEVEESTFIISANSAEVTLRESLINQFIYNYILESVNPNYRQRTLCETAACQYVYYEFHSDNMERLLIGIQGIWVRIEGERLFVHLAVDYDDAIRLSTIIIMEIQITNNLNELRADVVRVHLDRLRVPQFVLNQVIDLVADQIEIELMYPYEGNVDVDFRNLSLSILQRNMRNLNDYSQFQVDDVIVKDGGIIFVTRFSE